MKIPYSKKCEMNVRTRFRGKVPWLFGRFILNEDNIVLKYFFMKKTIFFKDIKKIREVDPFLEIVANKDTFQLRVSNAQSIVDFIRSKM